MSDSDILIETFTVPGEDARRVRITYTIYGIAIMSQRRVSLKRAFFEVFQQMHTAALKFIAKVIFSKDGFGKTYRQKKRDFDYNKVPEGQPIKELPENGTGDYIDAEIVK